MRRHIALLVVLGVLIFQQGISLKVQMPRVAVIGGGIGGASASHFLTELFNGTVNIDLYEARTIGGRLATIKIDRHEVEVGGSLIHPENMYMEKFVKLLGLEKITLSDRNFGVWNGEDLFLHGSFKRLQAKIFLRYGFEPDILQSTYIDNMTDDFVKIYCLQDAERSFANVTALLSAMNKNFPKQLQTSTRDYLLHMGFTEKLINELVQAATVVNYGQEVDIHSFVGLMSLAAIDGNLWSVKGGNKKLPELLIYKNKNVNVIRGRVTKVRNLVSIHNSSQYEITYLNKGSKDPITSNYDIVIIAAPLTSDQEFQIEFVDFPDYLVFPGNYQTMHVTIVKGDLNLEYFGWQWILDGIFSCNPNKTKINWIGEVDPVDDLIKRDSRVWKIFSREPMETNHIHYMFSHIIKKKEIVWKAYPRYSTNMSFDKFKLHDALYYVNVIEWAASTMEMSAIAGRNVAILAHKDFLRKLCNFKSNIKASKDLTKNLLRSTDL